MWVCLETKVVERLADLVDIAAGAAEQSSPRHFRQRHQRSHQDSYSHGDPPPLQPEQGTECGKELHTATANGPKLEKGKTDGKADDSSDQCRNKAADDRM